MKKELKLSNILNRSVAPEKFQATEERLYSFEKDKQLNLQFPRGGMVVPLQRDLTIGTAASGGNLAPTKLRDDLTEIPYDNAIVDLGINVVDAPASETIVIPGITTTITSGFEASEGAGIAEDTPATTEYVLSPVLNTTFAQISKPARHYITETQSTIVQRDMESSLNDSLIAAIVHGDGTGEPEGLENNSSVQSVTGTDFGRDTAAEVIQTSFDVKVHGPHKWLMNPTTFSTLLQRPRVSGTDTFMIDYVDGAFRMNGFPIVVSNGVNDNFIFFGPFGFITLVLYGGVMMITAVRRATTNKFDIFGDLFCNFAIQNPSAFIKSEIT